MEITFNFNIGTIVNLIIVSLLLWRIGDRLWVLGIKNLNRAEKIGIFLLTFGYLFRGAYYLGTTFYGWGRGSHGFLVVWSQPIVAFTTLLIVDRLFSNAEQRVDSQRDIEGLKSEVKSLREKVNGIYH